MKIKLSNTELDISNYSQNTSVINGVLRNTIVLEFSSGTLSEVENSFTTDNLSNNIAIVEEVTTYDVDTVEKEEKETEFLNYSIVVEISKRLVGDGNYDIFVTLGQKTEQELLLENGGGSEDTPYKNAMLSMYYDGLKYTANTDNPFALTFPMYVVANMYYKYEDKIYICIKSGVADEISEEYFVENL